MDDPQLVQALPSSITFLRLVIDSSLAPTVLPALHAASLSRLQYLGECYCAVLWLSDEGTSGDSGEWGQVRPPCLYGGRGQVYF